jgi:hypothetical protein
MFSFFQQANFSHVDIVQQHDEQWDSHLRALDLKQAIINQSVKNGFDFDNVIVV